MPLSSSSVMKIALPLPGRWRIRTTPGDADDRAVLGRRDLGSSSARLRARSWSAGTPSDGPSATGASSDNRSATCFGERHRRQLRIGFVAQFAGFGGGEQRQHTLRRRAAPPIMRRGVRVRSTGTHRHRRAAARLATEAGARRASSSTLGEGAVRASAICAAHSSRNPSTWRKPSRSARLPSSARSRQIVPIAGIDVDLAHLDPMLARVADELGGGVEAHRLRIEQARRRTPPGGNGT